MMRVALAAMAAMTVAGCVSEGVRVVALPPSPPLHDPLYRPERVVPGRLEYAPDRTTFAPILTERTAYPTQRQANDAYQRLVAFGPGELRLASVRLFGCKPGALDTLTARIRSEVGAVHCATDFLDGAGRPLGRRMVNFTYVRHVWAMRPVDAPSAAVPWLAREKSPKDPWLWLPGRDRYE